MELRHSPLVVVGMSGGVDSSVAALLLKQQGYRVIGLFMKNWNEENPDGACTAAQDFEDVKKVCEKIDIPYYSVDFSKEYWENVFVHFLEEYKQGFTPNPDILCNREIKFNVFFKEALKLGADFLATGHYCQTNNKELLKGRDPGKDQSYFLYTNKDHILKQVLFPIGHLLKSEVRAIAKEHGLATFDRKDSTGICFIGERNFKKFLSNYLKPNQGPFKTLDGTDVGKHDGVQFYTLGQRKGLGLGGQGEAWFVVKKDEQNNIVYVERGEQHPALYSEGLSATEFSFVNSSFTLQDIANKVPWRLKAKVRYRQQDQDCIIEKVDISEGKIFVRFDIPQRAITPRQSIVFYDGDICLGGAMIEKPYPSFYDRNLPLPEVVGV